MGHFKEKCKEIGKLKRSCRYAHAVLVIYRMVTLKYFHFFKNIFSFFFLTNNGQIKQYLYGT